MDWNAIMAVAEILGVVLLVVSLIYVSIQLKQNNQLARAESERDILRDWNHEISKLVRDASATHIFQKALVNFDALSNVEKCMFMVRMANLINVYISCLRMAEKGMINDKEVIIFGDVCFSIIITPGGRQWWSVAGPLFTIKAEIDRRIEREGDSAMTFIDIVPFWVPDHDADQAASHS
jgi:hypothetical protein